MQPFSYQRFDTAEFGSKAVASLTGTEGKAIEGRPASEFLAGGTLHVGKKLDIYAYGGEEREKQTAYTVGTVYNGLGNPAYDNTGCETENATNCSGNTHWVEQFTGGFWDRPYVGKWGKFQFGMQYSYTERHAFPGYGTAGAAGNASPVARDNMILTSIRYYPF